MIAFLTLTLTLTAPAAVALDLETRITEMDGSVPLDDKGQPVVFTVGKICINALMQPQTGDENEAGEEKIKRAVLAERIFKKEDYKFSAEEIATIKKRVNRYTMNPLIVRQVWEALEKK
jgi:hypothetical protein